MAGSNSYNSPCAACKFLRRKCMPGCIFAPYFPPEEPQKFANVHKIFGASNVTKLLNELLPNQREDAVSSLAYEAEARVRDPVYGCVGAISYLQRQVERLQKELNAANAELIRLACNDTLAHGVTLISPRPRLLDNLIIRNNNMMSEEIAVSVNNIATFRQTPSSTTFSIPSSTSTFAIPLTTYHIPWTSHDNTSAGSNVNECGGELQEKGIN